MMSGAGARPRLVVVGAGVAGLAAARTALDARPELDVVVLERSPRAGGLVETEHTGEGFVVEHGADCLVTTKPAGMDTVRQLDLAGEVVTGTEAPRTAFVVRRGRLVPLPAGLAFGVPASALEMLRTPVLSWPAKVRMGLEPLLSPGPHVDDESVASFVARRFGRQMVDRVIDPLLGGVHGVPADELSVRACLPRMRELERAHGSVVAGMQRERRGRKRRAASAPGALPPAISLRRGMGALPEALARSLGGRVRLGAEVRAVERRAGGGYRVRLAGGEHLDADAVVMAAPAHVASALVAPLSVALATMLARVRHGRVDAVTLGFRQRDLGHPLAGTGFVVPASEGRATRACSWSSVKWPGRAPEGSVLMRSVLHAPEMDDEALVSVARSDLRELMGVEADPVLLRVRRIERALPVYEVGYLDRLEAMRHEAAGLGAFALAGNAQGGIGVPDCIQSGREAAGAVLGALSGRRQHAAGEGGHRLAMA